MLHFHTDSCCQGLSGRFVVSSSPAVIQLLFNTGTWLNKTTDRKKVLTLCKMSIKRVQWLAKLQNQCFIHNKKNAFRMLKVKHCTVSWKILSHLEFHGSNTSQKKVWTGPCLPLCSILFFLQQSENIWELRRWVAGPLGEEYCLILVWYGILLLLWKHLVDNEMQNTTIAKRSGLQASPAPRLFYYEAVLL